MLKRTRIREVVPEVLSPNGSRPEPADETIEEPLPLAKREPEAVAKPVLQSVEPDPDAELAEALARAEAAQQEAEEAEARTAAARREAARLEAALAEAARALAEVEAAREEASREEAARLEAARRLEAELEQTRLEAKKLEETLLEATRTEFAAERTERGERQRPDISPDAPVRTVPAPPVTTSVVAEVPPAQAAALRTCEVRFWRGYRKGAFFARTIEAGEELAVAESPYFRARGNGIPEPTAEAEAAYAKLREELERRGWKVVAPGSTWFDATFEREPTDAAAPAPE